MLQMRTLGGAARVQSDRADRLSLVRRSVHGAIFGLAFLQGRAGRSDAEFNADAERHGQVFISTCSRRTKQVRGRRARGGIGVHKSRASLGQRWKAADDFCKLRWVGPRRGAGVAEQGCLLSSFTPKG